jgi:hypothetical protein
MGILSRKVKLAKIDPQINMKLNNSDNLIDSKNVKFPKIVPITQSVLRNRPKKDVIVQPTPEKFLDNFDAHGPIEMSKIFNNDLTDQANSKFKEVNDSGIEFA